MYTAKLFVEKDVRRAHSRALSKIARGPRATRGTASARPAPARPPRALGLGEKTVILHAYYSQPHNIHNDTTRGVHPRTLSDSGAVSARRHRRACLQLLLQLGLRRDELLGAGAPAANSLLQLLRASICGYNSDTRSGTHMKGGVCGLWAGASPAVLDESPPRRPGAVAPSRWTTRVARALRCRTQQMTSGQRAPPLAFARLTGPLGQRQAPRSLRSAQD